jgi:hypothetical protein
MLKMFGVGAALVLCKFGLASLHRKTFATRSFFKKKKLRNGKDYAFDSGRRTHATQRHCATQRQQITSSQ